MKRSKVRDEVLADALFYGELDAVVPFDDTERAQLHAARAFSEASLSSAPSPLQRAASPALRVTFVCMDGHHLLLVDHKASGLWRPTCGDVRAREHPRDSVRRLLRSDLGVAIPPVVHGPILFTVDQAPPASESPPELHLWYVLTLRRDREIRFDVSALHDVHWYVANELPGRRAEPNLRRFLAKLGSDATRGATRASPIKQPPQRQWCC